LFYRIVAAETYVGLRTLPPWILHGLMLPVEQSAGVGRLSHSSTRLARRIIMTGDT